MPGHSWPMRIALVAPPMLPIPPRGYAGTERVIDVLADELHRRGHAVTLFAAGDSRVDCELVPTVDRALWERGDSADSLEDLEPFYQVTQTRAWREHGRFDVIHSHLEGFGFLFARHCTTPVVTTLHGRLDLPGMPELISEYSEIPLVSISDNQRRWFPDANWIATVHHGLPLEAITHSDRPGPYLALVGKSRTRRESQRRSSWRVRRGCRSASPPSSGSRARSSCTAMSSSRRSARAWPSTSGRSAPRNATPCTRARLRR